MVVVPPPTRAPALIPSFLLAGEPSLWHMLQSHAAVPFLGRIVRYSFLGWHLLAQVVLVPLLSQRIILFISTTLLATTLVPSEACG